MISPSFQSRRCQEQLHDELAPGYWLVGVEPQPTDQSAIEDIFVILINSAFDCICKAIFAVVLGAV